MLAFVIVPIICQERKVIVRHDENSECRGEVCDCCRQTMLGKSYSIFTNIWKRDCCSGEVEKEYTRKVVSTIKKPFWLSFSSSGGGFGERHNVRGVG